MTDSQTDRFSPTQKPTDEEILTRYILNGQSELKKLRGSPRDG